MSKRDRKAWAKHLGVESQENASFKYSNEPTIFNGKKYPSKLEAAVAANLYYRTLDGELVSVEEQVRVQFYANGKMVCDNRVDFRVVTSNGEVWYIEAKGTETDKYKIQKALHIALLDIIHPKAKYFLVKGTEKRQKWHEVELIRNKANGYTGGFVKSLSQ